MPPSADDKIIEDAVQDFSKGLHSDLPLRHFAEFHDQDELKKMVDLRKENVLVNVIKQVWSRDKEEMFSLMKKVNDRINKEVIGEWVTRNREHRVKSVSFLQKWVDMLCDNFNMALEYQLLLNPDMEIESLKNEVERRKQIVATCFESIWKPGNSQIQDERKSKLKKQLKILEDEVFEKHQRSLESKSIDEGRELLGEVRSILLERSRQLKSYVIKHQKQVSVATLREMVEEIREYLLNGKGKTLKESQEEIYSNVMKIMEGEIKFLSEERKEKMTEKDFVGFADRFDDKLKSSFLDIATHKDQEEENQQDKNSHRQWTTMQGILNEFKEKQMDFEENGPDGSTHEKKSTGKNDWNDNDNDADGKEPGLTPREKKMRQRQSRRLKISEKVAGSNCNDPDTDIQAPEVTPSKKLRSGRNVARKITERADGGIHRRSLRLNKVADSKSISAKRENPRGKKMRDLDLTEKLIRRYETAHPSCEDEDEDIVNEDSMNNTDTLEPPPSPPHGLRMNKTSSRNKDGDSQQNSKSFKYSVSRTTTKASGRCGSPEVSSERTGISSVSVKPKERKLGQASKPRRGDDKLCPRQVTILKADCPKYSCNVCQTKFKLRKYLKYHGELCGTIKSKSFICDECGKGFHRKAHLDSHMQVHTGEKPFQCPKCPARFTRKWRLQTHIRFHARLKLKPYICKPCNLTFVSRLSLHEHNLTHEGALPFCCSYCDKRYKCMANLRYHVIFHADQRPFECTKCGAGVVFSRMEYLASHFENYHSQPKQMAQKLTFDACVAYLLRETKNESYRDIPAHKINAAVVNHVIKKENLQLPNAW